MEWTKLRKKMERDNMKKYRHTIQTLVVFGLLIGLVSTLFAATNVNACGCDPRSWVYNGHWVRIWDVNTGVKAPSFPWGYYINQSAYRLGSDGYWYTYRDVFVIEWKGLLE